MNDRNEDSNSSQNDSGSNNQQQNPPLRDTNTYLEKGEKVEITRKN